MKSLIALLFLLPACALAQHGCGATLSWKSPVCQTLSQGQLNKQWTVVSRHGEYGQNETECNMPSGVNQINGNLVITTTAVASTCGNFNADGTVNTTPASWSYTTGQIQWNTFNFTFGTVIFRTKYPNSNTNLWPSHWLLGANCQNSNKFSGDTGFDGCPNLSAANYTEIDMLECYNSGGWCQFHIANPGFGVCDATFAVDTNWHTYSMHWTSTTISISMDGVQQASCNQAMSLPMFMIILTQTGGVGGTPTNGNLPASHYTDYVQVLNLAGSTIFFDDFQPPVPALALRPLARMARLAGGNISSGAASIRGGPVSTGGPVIQ